MVCGMVKKLRKCLTLTKKEKEDKPECEPRKAEVPTLDDEINCLIEYWAADYPEEDNVETRKEIFEMLRENHWLRAYLLNLNPFLAYGAGIILDNIYMEAMSDKSNASDVAIKAIESFDSETVTHGNLVQLCRVLDKEMEIFY